MIAPLLADLRGNFLACGQVGLTVRFEDGSAQERTRVFFVPTAEGALIERALSDLLDRSVRWTASAIALSISLGQVQDAVVEQLRLFPAESAREHKLRAVQHYLAARFGAGRLWRATLIRPGAPLAEWRVDWQREEGG
jgi:hypothetical protein